MLWGILVLLSAAPAGGQCLGDFDTNGSVEISELITAVANSLNGCATPTATPVVANCPPNFSSPHNECRFRGTFSPARCPGAMIDAYLGTRTGPFREIRLADTPPIFLSLEATGPERAEATAWRREGQIQNALDAFVLLSENGNRLRIVSRVGTTTMSIDGCAFTGFDGERID